MLFSLFKNEVTNPQRDGDEVVEHEWAHEIHVKNEFCIRKDLVIFLSSEYSLHWKVKLMKEQSISLFITLVLPVPNIVLDA